jgi:oxygen-independent coproporphyrinogen-3 oxidase
VPARRRASTPWQAAGGAPAFAVYVHVPYCRVQCPYCTFYTLPRPEAAARMLPFLAALRREWALRVQPRLRRGERLATLYLGGGTPSDLPGAALVDFLRDLGADLPGGLAGLDEATVECNPESAAPALLDALRQAGVGRISLGVQALHDGDLRVLGRAADVARNRAALAAVASRFDSWNADLILGIPGSSAARLDAALVELAAAGAPHLSFYCLEMPPERARRLGDPLSEASEDGKAALYERASAWVEAHGYRHYEISNAARPGHQAVHNTAYWRGREYVGLGPGAHSLEAGERRANRADLRLWLQALEAGREPPAHREALTEGVRRREHVLLGLRQSRGLPWDDPALAGREGFLRPSCSAAWRVASDPGCGSRRGAGSCRMPLSCNYLPLERRSGGD